MNGLQAMSSTEHDDELPPIRITIPERYYLLPGAAIIVGTTIGLFRGSRTASLRFLAENAHRPPKTVRGWYLYNKTKNYRVLLGGLKGAGADATKLGLTAAGWVIVEEGCTRLGVDDVREVAAGLATGTLFGVVCEYGASCVLPLLLCWEGDAVANGPGRMQMDCPGRAFGERPDWGY